MRTVILISAIILACAIQPAYAITMPSNLDSAIVAGLLFGAALDLLQACKSKN